MACVFLSYHCTTLPASLYILGTRRQPRTYAQGEAAHSITPETHLLSWPLAGGSYEGHKYTFVAHEQHGMVTRKGAGACMYMVR